jgi:hypothetical protein
MSTDSVENKRYKIISLLYIVFICFAIVKINISVLDSNIYTIKTFKKTYDEDQIKIESNNMKIFENINKIKTDAKSLVYYNISNRLSKSILLIDKIIKNINVQFKNNNTSLIEEFNKDKLIEIVLDSDLGIHKLKTDLFSLSNFINSSEYKININIDSLIPINNNILNISGHPESFEDYLFKRKPTAISYLQLERIKFILIHSQLLYQEAALNQIKITSVYNKMNYYSNDSSFLSKKVAITDKNKEDELSKNIKLSTQNYKYKDSFTNEEMYKIFMKKVLTSLQTENIYIGLKQTLFNKNEFENFSYEITPRPNIYEVDNKVNVIFPKQGNYIIQFYDISKGRNLIYEKKFYAHPIPDPIVRVKGDNFSYTIRIKELLKSNRLEPILKLNNLNSFPGRINYFRLIRVHNGIEEESVYNYGELFQIPSQKLIGNLKKDDFLIFDNLTIVLYDGSSRISNPFMYKIID